MRGLACLRIRGNCQVARDTRVVRGHSWAHYGMLAINLGDTGLHAEAWSHTLGTVLLAGLIRVISCIRFS